MAQRFSSRLFPLEVGQVLTVSGKASKDAKRFDIDLMTGNRTHEDPGDVFFQFSVRFGVSGEIIRNSMTRNVEWGKDERQENLIAHISNANPIKAGNDFKIAIFVDEQAFVVSIDDNPFCTFAHRKPFHEIQRIVVAGDVEKVYKVDHTEPKAVTRMSNEIVLGGSFPRPFKAGSVIVLSAIPKGTAGDFALNLTNAESGRLIVHLRPYIGLGSVIFNDQDGEKKWRSPVNINPIPYPFTLGHSFKLAIAVKENEFQIAAHGQIIATIPFREGSRDVFSQIATYSVTTNNGLQLEVNEVDHFAIAANCDGFERFTKK